jgi:hypothetical protein
MVTLFFTELGHYLTPDTSSEMFVDITQGSERLSINFDVRLHRFPCAAVSVDAQDAKGTHISNIEEAIIKKRLNKDGAPLPDDVSPITTSLIKGQFDGEEGCQVSGVLRV